MDFTGFTVGRGIAHAVLVLLISCIFKLFLVLCFSDGRTQFSLMGLQIFLLFSRNAEDSVPYKGFVRIPGVFRRANVGDGSPVPKK